MPSAKLKSRPKWLQQRTAGDLKGHPQASIDMMRRLQQESCLEGHSNCVNCLEWNLRGNLLASGSDDRNVIIWDPFRGKKLSVISTGHQGNIFSVKFMPDYSDTVIATCASDCQVRLTDTLTNSTLMHCKSCHRERVKRLATHHNQPHLLWSAGEDGYVMQYDTREEHVCRESKPSNLLIDLKSTGNCLSAKCLAINPIRDEMMAIGANDIYNRLFDRRYLSENLWRSCVAYFAPGHLHRNCNKTKPHLYGTTYLAFSPNGSELLANMHAEQVYLFNTYEPWEQCKSFEATLKPVLQDHEMVATTKSKLRPYVQWRELKRLHKAIEVPEKHMSFVDEIETKLQSMTTLTMQEFHRINELLITHTNCPRLYQLRAKAFMTRAWRGDLYQAVRDSCCALALEPMNHTSVGQLALAAYYMGDKDYAAGLLDLIKILQQEFGDKDEALQRSSGILKNLLRGASSYSPDLGMGDEELSDSSRNHSPTETMTQSGFVQQLFSGTDVDIRDLKHLTEMFTEKGRSENERRSRAFDYTNRYCGHCNMNTDIKEANFFGNNGEYIVAGSDDGALYIWDKSTANVIKAVHGDAQILNCVQPHPTICMLATSGIESTVKLWSTSGTICRDVKSLEVRCSQNQDFIAADPLEAMIMMLYPDRDI